MLTSEEVEYLKPFIDSTIDAAARFRRVLIVMITASILGLGAAWNSTQFGWFNTRLQRTREAERYLALKDLSFRLDQVDRALNKSQDTISSQATTGLAQASQELSKLAEEREILLRQANAILATAPTPKWIWSAKEIDSELTSADYDAARRWIDLRGFYATAQASRYAQTLDEARTAYVVLVRLPFFGIVFDVNDLGLLGGLTFTVILMLFRFTLWREYNNLWVTFREAKPEHREYCYRSLAMQQVLTVPPSLSGRPPTLAGGKPPQKPKGIAVRALYFVPFLVQLMILVNDILTIPTGRAVNPKITIVSLGASSLFLGFVVFFTFKCFHLSSLIDKEWEKWKLRVEVTSSESESSESGGDREKRVSTTAHRDEAR